MRQRPNTRSAAPFPVAAAHTSNPATCHTYRSILAHPVMPCLHPTHAHHAHALLASTAMGAATRHSRPQPSSFTTRISRTYYQAGPKPYGTP